MITFSLKKTTQNIVFLWGWAYYARLKQTGQGREEEEVWPNRGNVKGAGRMLEEWRQGQLGIMQTYQENSL